MYRDKCEVFFAQFRSVRKGGVVERATVDPSASILRRDEHDGHVLESLLVCAASVGPDGVEVREATLAEPGRWDEGIAVGLRAQPGAAMPSAATRADAAQ